jgi:integrase
MRVTGTAAGAAAAARSDERKLVRTKTPGIYRRGKSYVVIYRAGGRQRKEFARTLDEARRIKRERETDRDRGELQERTTITLRVYLEEWVERYQGQGRRGFRENTRDEYRRLLERYAYRFFSPKLRIVDLTPYQLARFVDWLCDEGRQRRRLSDSTVANVVMPLRAALATAQREGLIRHNPSVKLALPHRERIEEDEDQVKVLSRVQLAGLLSQAPDAYRLLFELIAGSGLRVSEAIALQRRHVHVDGDQSFVKVRRAIVKRRVEPPKTRHGRRDVRISEKLAAKLDDALDARTGAPEALLFATSNGTPLDPDNVRTRTLKPLVRELGAPWAGFHTLRHTYASLQLAHGVNVVQLSRALGHHSPAFTLEVYAHLLPGEGAPALDLDMAFTSKDI